MDLSTSIKFKNIKFGEGTIELDEGTLRKCQKVILSIAEDVVSVCEENNIWFQLGGGTALGAVRHEGFIPWDDDIDLNVLGKDFETLKELIYKKYDGKYTFLDYTVSDYGLPMGRVMLNGTVYRDRESYGSKNCGFFIDIFPLENVPDGVLLRKIHGSISMVCGGLLSCRKFFKNRKFLHSVAEQNPNIKNTIRVKIAIGACISFIPLSKCAYITDAIYGMCKNENSQFVSFPSGRKHYFGDMYERQGMIQTRLMNFEGHLWPVPEDYDSYFKKLYGDDYMTPPPEEKREHHVLLELKIPEKMK